MRLILRYFLRRHYLSVYPSRLSVFSELFSILFSLFIYWFTAKALEPAIQSHPATQLAFEGSFFSFVIWGEVFITTPLAIFQSSSRFINQSIGDGSWEQLTILPNGPLKPIFLASLAAASHELLTSFITVLFATFLFGVSIQVVTIPTLILLQLLFLPIFFIKK